MNEKSERLPGTGRVNRIGKELGALAALTVLVMIALALMCPPLIFVRDALPPVGGDFYFHGLMINMIMTEGWYPIFGSSYGYPFGLNPLDFPIAEASNIGLIKLLTLVSDDWFFVCKLYYIAGFPLCAWSAYLAMRAGGIGRCFAASASLLFALLPFHFLRTSHLALAGYFSVPLCYCGALFIWRGRISNAGGPASHWDWLAYAVGTALLASNGVYYAFFSCVLFAAVGLFGVLHMRKWSPLWRSGAGIGLITALVVTQILPSLEQRRSSGKNFSVWERSFEQTEEAGLKLTQMLLPTPSHRVEALKNITARYSSKAPLVNENSSAALGVLGSFGLVLSLGYLGLRGSSFRSGNSFQPGMLGLLNAVAIFYSTIGGAGVLFSMLVTPEIRATNRISVFIGFFSLCFLAGFAERLFEITKIKSRWARASCFLVFGLIVLLTLQDQIPTIDWQYTRDQLKRDRAFFSDVQEKVPRESAIFQLPYHPFPEGGSRYRFEDYSHLKGCLFAPALRWSMPVFRGMEGDIWNRYVANLPPDLMIAALQHAGFSAVYVHRGGYSSAGESELLNSLQKRFGPPLVDEGKDGRCLFYSTAAQENGMPSKPDILQRFQLDDISLIEGVASGKCNIDQFQERPAEATLRIAQDRCFLLGGWALTQSNINPDGIHIGLERDGRLFTAPALSHLVRRDVQEALRLPTADCGFLIYASTAGLNPGRYNIWMILNENGKTELCKTWFNLLVEE